MKSPMITVYYPDEYRSWPPGVSEAIRDWVDSVVRAKYGEKHLRALRQE